MELAEASVVLESFLSTKTSIPDDVLFHYTSFGGLKGILESGCIWATHSHYLNDSSESRHVLDLLKGELKKQKPSLSGVESAACERLLSLVDQPPSTQHFVASFSECGDTLSQWRAYCPRGGVSIGFEPLALKTASIVDAPEKKVDLAKVSYLSKETRIDAAVSELLQYLSIFEDPKTDEAWREQVYRDATYDQASLYKHESFAEEQEWRLIFNDTCQSNDLNYRFRTSQSLLIPYVEVKPGPVLRSFFNEIVIGPGPHQDLNEKAVRLLLKQENCQGCTVRRSTTPYRYW